MEAVFLLLATGTTAFLLIGTAFLRYFKRRMLLDPINLYLLNAAVYFIVQVPFILVPGNLASTVGMPLTSLWGQIWKAFSMEAGFTLLSLFTILFLVSTFVKRPMDGPVRLVLAASTFLVSGHRLYLFFLVPVGLILAAFAAKYGAALFLVDNLGAAQARTVILREAADFRFLFNFASTALAFLLFYLGLLLVKGWEDRRPLLLLATLPLFLSGAIAGFIITGTRSFVLTPIAILIQLMLMFSQRHNTPLKVIGMGFSLIFVASALDILRHGGGEMFLLRILYKGDSFADFRDYVWAIERFDSGRQEFWMGKTYLASWISFIPASLSQFREEWAFGRAIMRVLGWSSTDHFGIRPGITGSIYFNGGMALVALTAVLRGLAVFLEQRVYQVLLERKSPLFAKVLLFFLGQQVILSAFFFLNNSSLWPVYVNLIIIVGCFAAMPFLKLDLRADNRYALASLEPGGKPPPHQPQGAPGSDPGGPP